MKLSEIKSKNPNWNIVLVPKDMDMSEFTDCASCGKTIEYGEAYTSFEQITDNGIFGLPVCPICYEIEKSRKFESLN